ncbi:hypothetical protein GDO78_019327 [Eleutherodactylus coqui]|uniref:Pentraxin family member n=1 Tax=Eleutherodactylus coqui TaxID=57060 RepID=A0A8J6EIH1_ELECQ|nr:hypothetical protein GDO78_019327 [Eleutherodactylus coqui]
MRSLIVLSVIFCGCFAQKDSGHRTTILFPRQTSTDHVILKTTATEPLKQFTACMHSYTELTRDYSLLSIATPSTANAFHIHPMPPNNISISINNEDIYFRVDPDVLDWKQTCVAWDSETGLLQLWVNAKRYPRKVTTSRSPIGPQMSLTLGQYLDHDIGHSFVGEMHSLNMWDYVLSPEAITESFRFGSNINGNIINWKNQPYETKGDTMILGN